MRKIQLISMLLTLLAAAMASAVRAEEKPTPLTLPQAVDLALRNNPALRTAEGRESAAWAAADRASAENWPQVRLDGRFSHVSEVPAQQGPGGVVIPLGEEDTWLASASAQQLLWTGGRVSALVRQAGSGAAAAHAARMRTRQLVAAGAERAFFLLLAAQDDIDAVAKNLAAAEDHVRVAKSRLEARAAARFDVLRAEVAAEEARQEAIRAASGLEIARAGLLNALGLAEGSYRAASSPVPAGTPVARLPLEELLREAARLRPELAGLALQVDAADAGVAAARAERWPTVGLNAGYQLVTPESTMLFSAWSAGAFFSLPLLDGGRAAARRGEAAALAVQAKAALESAKRQIETEVRQALARAASADEQVRVAARRLEQAEELSRLAEVRYQGGAGTPTEVADAQASLARARSGVTRASAERGIAESELALAVGATAADQTTNPEVAR